jgi:hypothetical protein
MAHPLRGHSLLNYALSFRLVPIPLNFFLQPCFHHLEKRPTADTNQARTQYYDAVLLQLRVQVASKTPASVICLKVGERAAKWRCKMRKQATSPLHAAAA